MNIMLSLPIDLIKYILQFSNVKEVCSVTQTSKELKNISRTDTIWKNIYETKWALDVTHEEYVDKLSLSVPKHDWYSLYMCRHNLDSTLYQYGTSDLLTIAIFSGKANVVRMLLRYGTEIKITAGITPLSIAIDNLQYEIMDILLENGAKFEEDLDWPPLSNVVDNGDLNIIHIMLKHKVINKKNIVSKLYQAVNLCKIDILEMLLQYDHSNVERCKKELLVKFIKESRTSMTDIMLRNGTDPNFLIGGYEKNGYTPLHLAIELENMILISLLLNAKADPNKKIDGGPMDGKSPLCMALDQNNINIVHMLLQAGADTKEEKEKKMMVYMGNALKKRLL